MEKTRNLKSKDLTRQDLAREDSKRQNLTTQNLTRRSFIKAIAGGVILTLSVASGASLLSGCATVGEAVSGKREFTDDMGRTLKLPTPSELKKVYFTSGLAEIFCFTLNPEILGGTALQFNPEDKKYLPERMGELTFMGSLSEDGEINRELLMAEGIQIVFSISAVGLTQANLADANSLQNATNIPVVLLDGSMDKIGECYEKLGYLLGKEARAAELAQYCERVFKEVGAAVGNVPESEKVSLYYAEGPQGLQTEPSTSQHAVVFELAGAKNVAQVSDDTAYGMSNVSLEQVMAWNPDVIIAWSWAQRGGADERIRANDGWKNIKAVQDGRVYTMPDIPFAWLDRPPGVNRFLGVQWVANMLYPNRYNVDMVEVGREFYKLFYQVDVDADTMRTFLGTSYPPYENQHPNPTKKFIQSETIVSFSSGFDSAIMIVIATNIASSILFRPSINRAEFLSKKYKKRHAAMRLLPS